MKRETMILFVAIISGIAAFGLIFNFLKEASKPATSFVLTSAEIKKGQILQEKDLTMSPLIKNLPPKTYYDEIDDVVGKEAISDIPQGKLVPRSKVKTVEAAPPPPPLPVPEPTAIEIPNAMRALTLTSEELENIPPFLKPGDYVDILANVVFDGARKEKEQQIRTIMNSILVVAVGKSEKGSVESVTIALMPAQVESLLTVSKLGRMRLVISSKPSGQSTWSSTGTIEVIRGIQREKAITT